MSGHRIAPARATFPALGSTAVLLVTDQAALPEAERMLRADLAAIDAACSRFRPDSELVRLARHAGRAAPVSPLLAGALAAALRAARATGGLVDPTVGQAVVDLGYDRDFDAVDRDRPDPVQRCPAPGWWRITLDADAGRVLIPRGVLVDLGATAKAYAADVAAGRIGRLGGGLGVLVSLGGDLATAGPAPAGGWLVGVGDDHRAAAPGDPLVTVHSGGLATSSTTQRSWRRGGRTVHHIVDPRTGDVPDLVWRTVSVAAASCVDANAAATAAIVRGRSAPAWLAGLGLAARLVDRHGDAVTVAGWPAEGSAPVELNLWYVARATGMVSVLLLTGTVLLGILGPLRVGTAAWPRFALAGLHRNFSLLTLAFLGVHVVAVVCDSYVPIGWLDPVVPFVSGYHPFWVGLGAVAFDLLMALVVTSLLRSRVNPRLWRALHWLAYACWPVALIHALGVGTDAAGGWPLGVGAGCAAAVVAGAAWRLAGSRRTRLPGDRPTVAGRAV